MNPTWFETTRYGGVRSIAANFTSYSQSIANNQTTLSWQLQGAGTNSTDWYNTRNILFQVAGVTRYEGYTSSGIHLAYGTVVSSGSFTVDHNSDGSLSVSVYLRAGIYSYGTYQTVSGTMTLNTIPREATGGAYAPSAIGDTTVNWIETAWYTQLDAIPAGYVNFLCYISNDANNPQQNLIYTTPNIYSTGQASLAMHTALQTFFANNPNFQVDSNGRYYIRFYRRTTIGGTVLTSENSGYWLSSAQLKTWMKPTFANTPITSTYTDTPSSYLTTANTQILKALSQLRLRLTTLATMKYGATAVNYTISRGSTNSGAKTPAQIPFNWDYGVDSVVDTSVKISLLDSRRITHEYFYTVDSRKYSAPTITTYEIYKKVNSDNVYVKATGTLFKTTPVANSLYFARVVINSTNYSVLASITVDSNGNWNLPETNIGSIAGTSLTGIVSIADLSRVAINSASIVIKTLSPTLSIDTTNKRIGIGVETPVYDLDIKGKSIFDLIYPVGTVYENATDSANPSTKFGGTWLALVDRFLIGASRTYANGSTGGHTQLQQHNHTGTTDGNGSHNHNNSWDGYSIGTGASFKYVVISGGSNWGVPTNTTGNHTHTFTTANTGSGNSQNMPPYRAVYMWYRSA